ncbi:MAG: hypothetical protein KDD45_04535 [Bdellovibrionales bacterium]|nr:hypothetical protein [Bdellovibrionales bacterium]
MEPFSPTSIPALLICGHVVCQSCLPEGICMVCNSKKNVKVNPFKTLLVYYNKQTSSSFESSYNFSIVKKTGSGQGIVVESVPGTTTIGQLLGNSPDFNAFLSMTGHKTAIRINNKGLHYESVKNTPIAEIRNLTLIPSGYGCKRVNEISYYNRELGGKH